MTERESQYLFVKYLQAFHIFAFFLQLRKSGLVIGQFSAKKRHCLTL